MEYDDHWEGSGHDSNLTEGTLRSKAVKIHLVWINERAEHVEMWSVVKNAHNKYNRYQLEKVNKKYPYLKYKAYVNLKNTKYTYGCFCIYI